MMRGDEPGAFHYRRGTSRAVKAYRKLRDEDVGLVRGNVDEPGLHLPHCPSEEASEAAKALDALCASRPKLPPGRR